MVQFYYLSKTEYDGLGSKLDAEALYFVEGGYIYRGSELMASGASTATITSILADLAEVEAQHEKDIKSIQGTLSTYNTKIENNATDISALQGNYTSLNETVVGHTGTLSTYGTNISNLTSRIGTAEGKITTLEGQVPQIDVNKDAIEKLQKNMATSSTVEALEARVAANEGSISDHAEEYATLSKKVDDNSGNISALQTSVSSQGAVIGDLEADVIEINTALDNKVETSTYNAKVADLQSQITANAGDISGNSTSIGQNAKSITALEEDVSTINNTLTNKVDTTTLASEVEALNKTITDKEAALNKSISANATNISNLSSEVTNYKTSNDKAVSDLEERVSTNEGNISNLQSGLSNLSGDVEANTNAIGILNGDSATKGSVAYQIAEIVGNADTDYDTLVEISNWILAHPDSVAAINALIAANAEDISELRNDLTEEISRSTEKDEALTTALQAEVDRSTAKDEALDDKDTALETAINQEKQDRANADDALGGRIDDEITAREAKDLALDTEDARLAGLIETNANAIAAEKTRAEEAEEKLEAKDTQLVAEDERLAGLIQTNTTSIADHETRIDTLENEMDEAQALLVNHTSRLDSLDGELDTEKADRAQGDTDAISQANAYTDGEIDKVNDSISEVVSNLETLEGRVEQNETKITELQRTATSTYHGLMSKEDKEFFDFMKTNFFVEGDATKFKIGNAILTYDSTNEELTVTFSN